VPLASALAMVLVLILVVFLVYIEVVVDLVVGGFGCGLGLGFGLGLGLSQCVFVLSFCVKGFANLLLSFGKAIGSDRFDLLQSSKLSCDRMQV
jgi:hypothetical protein